MTVVHRLIRIVPLLGLLALPSCADNANRASNESATYTLSGTITGLTGAGLIIQNNGGDNLSISADATSFTFSTAPFSGAAYAVTVLAAPENPTQVCTVTNSSGVIGNANVTNVTIHCALGAPTLKLGFGIKQLQFTWTAIGGATYYRLLQNADGVSGFSPVGPNLGAGVTTTSLDIAVHKHDWPKARYIVEACNSTGCTNSNDVNTLGSVLSAIGYVKAANPGASDWFGFSVALSSDGNTLAVGAPFESSDTTGINSKPNELAAYAGAVYVFTHSGATWLQQAYVKASNTGAGDAFGFSVSLSRDGNTLAIGAPNEASDTTGINSTPNELSNRAGAVYVYARAATTWSQQAYVKASNTSFNPSSFGSSVALSDDGNTLAVGAPEERSSATGINNTPNESTYGAGAAYVYTRSSATWLQQAYVKASNTGINHHFGRSVALSNDGNTFAVGADGEASSSSGINSTPDVLASQAGAVYVYIRSGATWLQQTYVKASNTGEGDSFGYSVVLSGDGNTLAVGAPSEYSNSTGIESTPNELAYNAGAVYVYTRAATTWAQRAYVKSSNTETGDGFGNSIALNGDGNTLAVGAYLEDSGTPGINSVPNDAAADAGAVYLY